MWASGVICLCGWESGRSSGGAVQRRSSPLFLFVWCCLPPLPFCVELPFPSSFSIASGLGVRQPQLQQGMQNLTPRSKANPQDQARKAKPTPSRKGHPSSSFCLVFGVVLSFPLSHFGGVPSPFPSDGCGVYFPLLWVALPFPSFFSFPHGVTPTPSKKGEGRPSQDQEGREPQDQEGRPSQDQEGRLTLTLIFCVFPIPFLLPQLLQLHLDLIQLQHGVCATATLPTVLGIHASEFCHRRSETLQLGHHIRQESRTLVLIPWGLALSTFSTRLATVQDAPLQLPILYATCRGPQCRRPV